MRLRALLICLIPTLFAASVRASGSSMTAKPGDDLQTDLVNAQGGGVLTLSDGTYNITTPLRIYSNTTITAQNPGTFNAHVNFNIGSGNSYGFILDGNASGVTISQLDLYSNHGLLMGVYGSGYSNINIANNQIQTLGGTLPDGVSLIFGIYVPIPTSGLNITHNYFHDSVSTARNWTTFYSKDSHYDYNLFDNINDGGQICYPGENVTFNNNYGTHIQRMGQEIPCAATTTNLQVNNNVFYDYINPYYNTEGVSVVGSAVNVSISGNYFDANIAAGSSWGQADGAGVHRFGYAIEATGTTTSDVTNNTLIGPWAELVSSDVPNANVSGNSVYGAGLWGDFEGEPGTNGYGSVVASNNSIDRNADDAPAPISSDDAFAGPKYNNTSGGASTGGGSSGGAPTSSGGGSSSGSGGGSSSSGGGGSSSSGGSGSSSSGGGGSSSSGGGGSSSSGGGGSSSSTLPITGTVVSIQSNSSVSVTFNSPSTDIVSAQVDVISTIGRQNFPSDTVAGLPDPKLTIPSVTITGLHAGWYIDFTVEATGSKGQQYKSNPVTVFMPGSYSAPWQGLLWGGISVLQTDPYVQ